MNELIPIEDIIEESEIVIELRTRGYIIDPDNIESSFS